MKTTTPIHRMLALALLLTTLGSIYLVTVQPLLDAHRRYDQRIDQARLQLSKLNAIVQSEGTIRAMLKQARENQTGKDYFLTGRTPGLAAANLQNHLRGIIEAGEGQLVSIRDLATNADDRLTTVRVNVRIKASTTSLQEILYAIETRTPLIFIDKVSIRSRAHRGRRAQITSAQALLDIQLDLSGYAHTAAPEGSV